MIDFIAGPFRENRICPGKTGRLQVGFGFEAVKTDPDVMPGIAVVGFIIGDDLRINKKPLPALELIVLVIDKKGTLAVQNIVEKVMIAHRRAISMPGFTGFYSTVVDIEIGGELFIRKIEIPHAITSQDLLFPYATGDVFLPNNCF